MRKEDNAVENDFKSVNCTVESTLMKDKAGSWIEIKGYGGGGRRGEVSHWWSRQAVSLT